MKPFRIVLFAVIALPAVLCAAPTNSAPSPAMETPDWFECPAVIDTLAPSILDRFRPAAPAGAHGPAQVKDGCFVLPDGTRVRYWGVNIEKLWPQFSKPEIDECADRLARLGVQCVRFYPLDSLGGIGVSVDDEGTVTVDPQRLDTLEYFVAKLKQAGIYTTFSFSWFGFGDRGSGDEVNGLRMLTDPVYHGLYEQYVRQILLHTNPYTGRTSAQEPAILFAQLINEGNLFFWGAENVYGRPYGRERWQAWLRQRYTNDAGLKAAWGQSLGEGEDLASGSVTFLDTWHLQLPVAKDAPSFQRQADQGRFATEYQLESYLRFKKLIQNQLGSTILLCGSPWSGPGWLDALDEYSNVRVGVLCRHGYWDHPRGGWSATTCKYDNQPMVRNLFTAQGEDGAGSLIQWFGSRRAAGAPFVADEFQTCAPNDYRLEGTMLLACTAALQDWDGLNQFAITRFNDADRLYTLGVFECTDPSILSQFPIASLVMRGGYLAPGKLAWRDCISEQELYDPTRQTANPRQRILVGRCEHVYGEGDDVKPDVSAFISADGRVVKSNTGELEWRGDPGVLLVSAPRVKGLVGFADGATHELGGLTMQLKDGFVSVFVAALDKGDINSATSLFMHAVGQTRNTDQGPHVPTGEAAEATGTPELKLEKAGSAPILMKAIRGRLVFAKPLKAVYALDMSGRRMGEVLLEADGTALALDTGNDTAVWYELVR
jgi:hypothetical protein